nr:MAG: hypothetical protein [Marsupenaeus japonicus endogenous nimavirus]
MYNLHARQSLETLSSEGQLVDFSFATGRFHFCNWSISPLRGESGSNAAYLTGGWRSDEISPSPVSSVQSCLNR